LGGFKEWGWVGGRFQGWKGWVKEWVGEVWAEVWAERWAEGWFH